MARSFSGHPTGSSAVTFSSSYGVQPQKGRRARRRIAPPASHWPGIAPVGAATDSESLSE